MGQPAVRRPVVRQDDDADADPRVVADLHQLRAYEVDVDVIGEIDVVVPILTPLARWQAIRSAFDGRCLERRS
jgi:hypothetical protein